MVRLLNTLVSIVVSGSRFIVTGCSFDSSVSPICWTLLVTVRTPLVRVCRAGLGVVLWTVVVLICKVNRPGLHLLRRLWVIVPCLRLFCLIIRCDSCVWLVRVVVSVLFSWLTLVVSGVRLGIEMWLVWVARLFRVSCVSIVCSWFNGRSLVCSIIVARVIRVVVVSFTISVSVWVLC